MLTALLPGAAGWTYTLDGSLAAATDNVFRGLTQSQGDPSVQIDGYISTTHWFGSLTAETVKRESSEATGAELVAYLGYQQLLSEDWSGAISVRHYDYPGNPNRALYNYDELSASVNWRQQLVLALVASPDTYAAVSYDRYGRGSAYAAELTGREPLPYGMSVEAGVGYYDLNQEIGAGYAYWSAGLGKQWRAFEATLRYIGTDAQARRLFDSLAGDRVVASVAWFF
jgi:uncharacterized protein (TIGR02001 family)